MTNKFRSCAGTKYTGTRFPIWHNNTPEGLFYFGEQTDGGHSAAYRVLWINMPYAHPSFGGAPSTWHCFPILSGKWDEHHFVDDDGDDYQEEFIPDPDAPVPTHTPWWQWDGNEDQPTLKPSITCGPTDSPYWHGHIQNGMITSE